MLAGLAVIAVLVAYDTLRGEKVIVIGVIVLGPFLTARLGTTHQTAFVAVVATTLTFLSGWWNQNFLSEDYFVRACVSLVGGLMALFAARERNRTLLVTARFALLGKVADIAQDALTLQDAVDRLAALLVPQVADQCSFDLTVDGRLQRVAVRINSADAARQEAFLRGRRLPTPELGRGSRLAVASKQPQIFAIDDALLVHASDSDEDLAGLRALDLLSTSVVPLNARRGVVGALTLSTSRASGRRFTQDDAAFHVVLAGRAALALDNAGLDSELQAAERQLGAALGHLDEAIAITDTDGSVVYVNRAALDLLGISDADDLYDGRALQSVARFNVFDEHGAPVGADDFPWRVLALGNDSAEPLLVRAVDRTTGNERWLVLKASPIRADAGELTRIVTVAEDVTAVKARELRARLLADATAVLTSSMNYERTLQRVAEMAVPDLADWCGVALPDERGYVRTVAVAHSDPEKAHFARELAERYPEPANAPGGAPAVIRNGIPQVVNDISDELLVAAAQDDEHLRLIRELGIRAGLTVPMAASGKVVGALTLVSAESRRVFSDADVELASELARRAGAAVENARLFTERSQINAALQRGLLPPDLPAVPGWSATPRYRPAGSANDVGGDFYDLFQTPAGWLAVMGDVTGHGAQAARLTAVARFALRAVAELTGDPLAAIGQLNRMLLDEPELSLVTLACVLLHDTAADGTARVDVVRCGHPAPLHRSGNDVSELGEIGPIVGAFAEAHWQLCAQTLAPGDALLLYTDGVTDLTGRTERFGAERLTSAFSGGGTDPGEIVARIGGKLAAFREGPQRDDEALLALRLDSV